MAEPTQYTTATKMFNPISSSLEEGLVCIRLFTEVTLFTKAIKSNKTLLKCRIDLLKQPTEEAKEHPSLPQTWWVWGEGDKGLTSCQPTSSKPSHQSLIPREHPDNHLSQSRRRKRGSKDTKHSHAFLSHLSPEADGSTLFARSHRTGSCAIRRLLFLQSGFKLKS